MKINRKVEYALIALRHMQAKKPGTLTSAKEVADLYGCSFDVTARVMQKLAAAKVLLSSQGAHGGYQVIRDLDKLSFYELNSILLGELEIAKCISDEGSDCELRDSCNIVSPIQKLNERLKGFYKELPVSELIQTNFQMAVEA